MDIEKLTKHQIILLTLLVALVTSIATGIVTVSLLDQQPQGITRTINQIVERTVQTVVPASQDVAAAAATVTTKTVVVRSDDLAAQSIATVQKSIVRITVKGGEELVARGVIVDSKGTTLTDSDSLAATGATSFDAILSDGTRVPVSVVSDATSSAIAVVTVLSGTSTAAAPALLADSSKLQLGQSIIRIGGKGIDTVGQGVIATLPSKNSPNIIEASVTSVTPGSLIMDIFGSVIGIATTDSLKQGSDYYTIATVPAPPAPKPKTQ
ncbi:hypothetical protein A2419_00315 [Candidatus Adlerbacteria bacterium RIFOXYC1_FULL_48_26]|uniref:Uncharacterized protein n=1 Tax=Candidatus Adlerbacteria bacterium RIFOXYC1_FULL_48_26 TaxID=1797247 RepID=A0A1F4Y3E5_9BACT|nr:MAG: hypothetical protein A2419_00315 [Candidatus Adlerbacteria bacterium RIFOXYC1_FULL_48_26]